MFIDNGQSLVWSQPIGRSEPYPIKVKAFALDGRETMAWNLSVSPIYTAAIDAVLSSQQGNTRYTITGSVHFPDSQKVLSEIETGYWYAIGFAWVEMFCLG